MPYEPHVTNHGGEYIMRGAEIASRAIAAGLAKSGKDSEDERQLNGIRKAYPDLFGDAGSDDNQWKGMSLEEKRGAMQATQIAYAQNRDKAEDTFRDRQLTDQETNAANNLAYNYWHDGEENREYTPRAVDVDGTKVIQTGPKQSSIAKRAPTPSDRPVTKLDPVTGAYFKQEMSGEWKPLPDPKPNITPNGESKIYSLIGQNAADDAEIEKQQGLIDNGNKTDGGILGMGGTPRQTLIDQANTRKQSRLNQIEEMKRVFTPSRPGAAPASTPAPVAGGYYRPTPKPAPSGGVVRPPVPAPALPQGGGAPAPLDMTGNPGAGPAIPGPAENVSAPPAPSAQTLTPEGAARFLQLAGGDKDKARQLARASGFQF